MIAILACDLCAAPLVADVARLQIVRGRVALLMRQRWRVEARPAGHRSLLTCRACAGYIGDALQHLRETSRRQRRAQAA